MLMISVQVMGSVPQLRKSYSGYWVYIYPSYDMELCRFLGLCPSYKMELFRLLGLCPSYEESYAGSWVCAHSYEESYERANDDNTYDVHSLVCYGITSLVSYVNRSSSQRDSSQRDSSQRYIQQHCNAIRQLAKKQYIYGARDSKAV